MSSRAFDRDASARGRGNFRHHPERYALAFQKRSLLDVQFDKRFVIAARQFDVLELSLHPGFAPNVFDRFAILICQFSGGIRRQSPGEQPAADASDSEARRLFRRQNQQLD